MRQEEEEAGSESCGLLVAPLLGTGQQLTERCVILCSLDDDW